MTPRVSVLIPCYNHGAFIGEAIASVRAQTRQDFEIVVVDDGSTEPETLAVLEALRAEGLQVFRTPNRGLPAARNHAAARASGAVFCSLDADDRLAPAWFERGLALLDERPSVAFVSHWLETFGDEQWRWTPERCDLPALLARNTVNGAALVRRAAFEAVGGYDESMRDGCEDWDFWLRLVEAGWPGAILPEVLFHYRRQASSMSRVMLQEAAYRRPLEVLVRKHEGAYREHLVEVLIAREREGLHLAQEVANLEQDRLAELEPALRRAREELAALALKAGKVRTARAQAEDRVRLEAERDALAREVEGLRAGIGHLRAEVDALRASWSWRLAAPLRRLYDALSRSGR